MRIKLPERKKPDAQILVTGLKENVLAAVAEIQLMANHKLLPQDVLVPLRTERDRELLVLGPDGCRAAKIQRDFGVRIVRPVNVNGPLMLEGSVEAVTEAEAFGEHLLVGLRQASHTYDGDSTLLMTQGQGH